MATFRNAQIEDILNSDRKMNRVILDRTSAHIATIGDEKAPSTVRDIKLEATLGGLVDSLKESINKAIQLISGHQYGSLDPKKVDKLLKLDTKDQSNIKQNLINQALPKANEAIDESGTVPQTEPDEGDDDAVVAAQGNVDPLLEALDTNIENDD